VQPQVQKLQPPAQPRTMVTESLIIVKLTGAAWAGAAAA
jgi:hypothetical protein